MGSNSSTLSTEELADLAKQTKFSKRQLSQWNNGFLADYPSGLTRSDFETIFKNWFPFGESSKLSQFMFSMFDLDEDGVVDFKDFIATLSIYSKQSLQDKLQYIFKMYDVDDDGYIGRAELEYLIELETRAVGELVDNASRAQILFDRFDVDKDGRISFDEFKNGMMDDERMMNALEMYSGLI